MGSQSRSSPDAGRRQDRLLLPVCLLSLFLFLLLFLFLNLPLADSAWSATLGQSRDYPFDCRTGETPACPDRDADRICQVEDEVKDYLCLPASPAPKYPPELHPLPSFILRQLVSKLHFRNHISRSPPPLFSFS
jgi:hypothetical protein